MGKSKKIFCLLTACALCALCALGAAADDVSLSAFGGTPTWYHLYESDGVSYYKSYGTNQLTDSDVTDDSAVYFRVDRVVNPVSFNSLGDFIQLDLYFTAQAVAPGFGGSSPFTSTYWSNRFVSIYPASSKGAPISYYDPVQVINRDYLVDGTLATVSLIVTKQDFLTHVFTQGSNTTVSFMLHARTSYVAALNGSNLLYFTARVTATDEINTDEKTMAILTALSADIQGGFVSLEDAQEAATAAIRDGAYQAHSDARATQDKIDNAASDVVNAIEEQQDREKQEAQEAIDEAVGGADMSGFDVSGANAGLNSLISALSYEGTDFSFTFPAADNVPFVGKLWDSQNIPFQMWIDNLPPVYLTVIRFLLWVGGILSLVALIKLILRVINRGFDD